MCDFVRMPKRQIHDTAAARLEADERAQSAKNGICLPFLDTYRTMCLAPLSDFRRVLEDVLAMQLALKD